MISLDLSPSLAAPSTWRPLCRISSAAEAAMLSARCRFSLATAEVDCRPAETFCALVEQELPGLWRWAIYDVQNFPIAEGTSSSQAEAKQAALSGLLV